MLKLSDKLECKGRVSYHESAQAYNTLRLPKLILDNFPDLKDKTLRIKFKIKFFKSDLELKKFIWDLGYNNEQPPLLLFLFKENGKK